MDGVELNLDSTRSLIDVYPKPVDVIFRYGTAGFRLKASEMEPVFSRIGIVAFLRSLKVGAAVGLMTTASHNLVEDNGIKLIDPDGGMLEMHWEQYATEIVNAESFDKLLEQIVAISKKERIPFDASLQSQCAVFVGRDTRPHSEKLLNIAVDVINALNHDLKQRCQGVKVVNFNVLTTPQLHYSVRHFNTRESRDGEELSLQCPGAQLAERLINLYYTTISRSFLSLLQLHLQEQSLSAAEAKISLHSELVVDAGFGVGGMMFQRLSRIIDQQLGENSFLKELVQLNYSVVNCASEEDMKEPATAKQLNNMVGAEFVQKQKQFPKNIPIESASLARRYASFDGDADRLVYFYPQAFEGGHRLCLLDGDKMTCLLASYLLEQVVRLPAELTKHLASLSICIVQTAYANGASTIYINQVLKPSFEDKCRTSNISSLQFHSKLVKTGVKYLHHEAVKHDLSIYFEANGHGTVLFSPTFLEALTSYRSEQGSQFHCIHSLLLLSELINQATGDAMTDCLAIEAVLAMKGLSLQDWNALYVDLPSTMTKVIVKDRSLIETNANETRVETPSGLQPRIDALVAAADEKSAGKKNCSRCFVRPSGTEDVVRVYAEAETQDLAVWLNSEVQQVVREILA